MTQVRRKLSLVLWTLLVMATVSASGQDLEKTLNAQYKDKILALRHPRQVNKQEYDASGAVVGDNSEGPWTLYGRIRVKQIQVKYSLKWSTSSISRARGRRSREARSSSLGSMSSKNPRL